MKTRSTPLISGPTELSNCMIKGNSIANSVLRVLRVEQSEGTTSCALIGSSYRHESKVGGRKLPDCGKAEGQLIPG